MRASRADSIALSEIATLSAKSATTSVTLDEVEGSKSKGKSKTAKTRPEKQNVDKKQKLEAPIAQIPVSANDSDGKLARSFSTYN